MEETNWNMASNTQLKEECERLENEYKDKQQIMEETCKKAEALHKEMVELSQHYVEVKNILDKRQGKKNGNTK